VHHGVFSVGFLVAALHFLLPAAVHQKKSDILKQKTMSANRSSHINLYAKEDKSDNAYRVEFEADQADFKVSGAQDFVLDFAQYQFTKADDSIFDLETRFDALETDATGANNAAAITALQADLAAEAVARQAGDTSNSAATTAEVDARVIAVAAVQAEVDAEEIRAAAAEAVNAAAIVAQTALRVSGDATEQARALAAEAALGTRIDNVLSNTDAASLDSLTEILAHISSEDATLLAAVAAAQAKADENAARLDELCNEQ